MIGPDRELRAGGRLQRPDRAVVVERARVKVDPLEFVDQRVGAARPLRKAF